MARVQPAFLAAVPPAVATVELALVLLTWLASRGGPDSRTVVSFPARVYEPHPDPEKEPVWVGSLSEDEFKNACPRHSEVQGLTNEAAAGARADRTDWSQQGFGTEVHKRVERAVNGTDKQTGESRSPDNPQDKNFVAEFSAWKIKVADAAARAAGYGDKDTIRVDVLENVRGHRTVCVYDIKTGERGLRPGRIKEIVGAVMKHFGNDNNIIRIIIAEVRPKP